jgi:uncharacterized protein (DUF58 family)
VVDVRGYNAVRPTLPGVWFLLVLAGLTFGAVNTGNNLVYAVLASLLGVLVVNNVLAEWNLRALQVRRVLPGELYAGEPGTGRFILFNPRRIGAAWRVEVEERDGGGARARFARVGTGEEVEEPASWTLPKRGPAHLGRVRISSRFPFGLVLRWRDLDIPADVLVYPGPERGTVDAGGLGLGSAATPRPAREGVGDLAALRPYAPGDPVRRIHWPTTARTGAPVVAVRGLESGGQVVVRLSDGGERAIRRACGEILLYTRRGDAVGLEGAGQPVAPRAGAAHRRHLLTVLALLPEIEA